MQIEDRKENLFHNPKNYFYSDCTQDDFYENWSNERDSYINRLELSLKTVSSDFDNNDSRKEKTNIDETMDKIWLSLNSSSSEDIGITLLNKYLQKYEVGKKFYTTYTSKHIKDTSEVYFGYSVYIIFANSLIFAYNKVENLQYLSTLLKLCDAFISVEPKEYTIKEVQSLIHILNFEKKLLSGFGEK